MNDGKFSSLKLPNICYKRHHKQFYRLYKAQNDFIDIEAESATDAIKKSGFNPIRIEHIVHYLDGLIDKNLLKKETDDVGQLL